MRPYISEILEYNGKTYTLPIPAKYRELLDCVHALGLKDEDDEEDVKLAGYKALYMPEPGLKDSHHHVEQVAIELSKLSESQVRAIGAICFVFALPYNKITGILACIKSLMEVQDYED